MTTPKRHPCQGKCRGGNPCACLVVYGETRHRQHICTDPNCACHRPAAFGLVLAVTHGEREVYVEAGDGQR